MKNYIGIARDHSGSMDYLTNSAMADYNSVINGIKAAAVKEGIDTIVSVVEFNSYVKPVVTNSSIGAVKKIDEYKASGQTAMYDAIGDLIELFEKMPDADNEDISFLINVITDGAENCSRKYTAESLRRKIKTLQETNRWSFTFRVPRGQHNNLTALGVPTGNILQWETTERGMRESTYSTQTAYEGYYGDRKRGATMTQSFYTADLSGVPKADVKKALTDITSQVKFLKVTPAANGVQIRAFVENNLGKSQLGSSFYQLTKKENEVQDHKLIAVRDKRTKKVYSGVEARSILGLPEVGTIRLVPGDHGEFDIFVQSKSVNRKLVAGTDVMYWNNVGSPR